MRVFSHCTALALLQLDCTCSALHTRAGRARSVLECAVPDVVRRLFGEGTMLERFALEMLRVDLRLRLLRTFELASELSHIWITRGARYQPRSDDSNEAHYDGLANTMVLREGRSLKDVLTKAFRCPDERVKWIFLGRSFDAAENFAMSNRASFLVAALLAVLDSGALAEGGELIVRLIKGLGLDRRAYGVDAPPGLSTWARGEALQAVVVGLVTLFNHNLVGPVALEVFQLDDPDNNDDANLWFGLINSADQGFCFTQLVGALHALHDEGLEHALVLLHDMHNIKFPNGQGVPDPAACAAALLQLLESVHHRCDWDVMKCALNLFHEGDQAIWAAISHTDLQRWVDAVVKVMTLHPEPGLSMVDAFSQENSVMWNGVCALKVLARRALWGRGTTRVHGTILKEVEERLPSAAEAIVQLALPRLLYSAEQFGNDTSMMHFGMSALTAMAISPAVARDCRGLSNAITRVLQMCFSMNPSDIDDDDDVRCAARADELLAEGLTALGYLALYDGNAVVAAGAIPIAVEVLQDACSQRAWEAAVRLLGFLSSDPASVEAAACWNLFPPFMLYLRSAAPSPMPAAIDGRAPERGGPRRSPRARSG